ncbi:MAG: formylglycine-generating enzyme family protein [Pseudomonadota bacterium]
MSVSISAFDIAFWLLIALIACIAFAIESGVVTRHRKMVVSSLFSSTLTALALMFLVEDNSTFQIEHHKVGPQGGPKAMKGMTLDESHGASNIQTTVNEGLRRTGDGVRDCDQCPAMVVLDNGQFFMGSAETETGRKIVEGPRKPVTIPQSFAISKYPILKEEYREFVMEAQHQSTGSCRSLDASGDSEVKLDWENPGFQQDIRHPVVCVSVEDAKAYVAWLSEKTKQKYRLVTQAEWEYAARAGSTDPHYFGERVSAGDTNFGNERSGTTSATTFRTNGFGIADMIGNTWDITADCWTPDLTTVPDDATPAKFPACPSHVIKGGAFNSKLDQIRAAARRSIYRSHGAPSVGFRVARQVEPVVTPKATAER